METIMTVDFALLILRLMVGLLFVGHGAQKLLGLFDGPGLEGTTGFMESLGLPAPGVMAVMLAVSEFFGGLGLALGIFPQLSALAIVGSMLMAMLVVHFEKGFWNTDGGYEFNLILAASAIAIALAGPGAYSLQAAYDVPTLSSIHPWMFPIGLLAVIAFDLALNAARESEAAADAA